MACDVSPVTMFSLSRISLLRSLSQRTGWGETKCLNIETLKCLRDGKNIGGGWMDGGHSSKAVLTTQMTWNGRSITFLPHNISPTRMLEAATPTNGAQEEKGKMFQRASKIFTLLLPLTVSPTQPASHTEPRFSITSVFAAAPSPGLNFRLKKVGRGCVKA